MEFQRSSSCTPMRNGQIDVLAAAARDPSGAAGSIEADITEAQFAIGRDLDGLRAAGNALGAAVESSSSKTFQQRVVVPEVMSATRYTKP